MTSSDDEQPIEIEQAEQAGDKTGGFLAMPVQICMAFFASLLVGVTRRIPGRKRIQKGMIKSGIEGLWKTSSAAVIVMVIYGDGVVVPRPGEIDSEEGKIRTDNDEEWTLTDINMCRMGNAPVVWGVADDHELASPVAARVAEAVDSDWGRTQAVKETPEGIKPVDYQTPQQAVADGGQQSIREPFDDVWVDARNPVTGAAGWIVSMAKGYEMHWSQSSTEEMQMQETRGRLAEMDPEKYDNRAIKLLIVAGASLALGLFGPALAQRVAGSGAAEGASSPIGFWIMQTLPTLGVM
ncbi:hypothetical protein [Natronorubrum halophilum]|uniref:hypothetical protein n=1 Tax=Natronorubrum halophilum TaxID=1702106 RepID=UPI0013CE7116|nr:hypothetical protein [Natronorubrum halophilum]